MRALAHRSESPRNHDAFLRRDKAAAGLPAAPRSAAALTAIPARSGEPRDEAVATFVAPPDETDAWWLSRSQTPTFTRRWIQLSDECVRALSATGDATGRIVVEFNGASFLGAATAVQDGRLQLDLGDALALEMAGVLDEDDGLAVELIPGRSQPTLAIHPYVDDAG